MVKKSRRGVEALESELRGHDIPIYVRTSVLKTCMLPVLTYGFEVWRVNATSGANRSQPTLNQCLRRLVGVGGKANGVAIAPLMRGLRIAPIEATAVAARTRALTLDTTTSDRVGQPICTRLTNTWTCGTVCWLDRIAKASAELAQGVHIPHTWRSLQPRDASILVKAEVWDRVETPSSACTHTWSSYSHVSYVGN
jgi:hypothetical protein